MDQATRASNLLDAGKFKSIRKAAAATGAARSTVSDRRAGRNPQSSQRQPNARLWPEQVNVLKQYIIDMQLQYAPVNNTQLGVVAEMLARQKEPGARLGKNWISRFLKDHVGLVRGRNRSFEGNRIEATIPQMISGWYTYVGEVIRQYNIHPQDQ